MHFFKKSLFTKLFKLSDISCYTVIFKKVRIGAVVVCSLFAPVLFAQTCLTSNMPDATTPSSDFTVHNDGTVTHKSTGLMWKVCSEGQTWAAGTCSGTITTHAWDTALEIPQALNSGEEFPFSKVDTLYSDWRVPNIEELTSLIELQCYAPAINAAIFPNSAASFYWSSSPSTLNRQLVKGVDFDVGYIYSSYRIEANRVRLVRDESIEVQVK